VRAIKINDSTLGRKTTMFGVTITVSTVLSLLGLAIAFFYMKKVISVPVDMGLNAEDSKRLKFIHGAIAQGAMAFLKQRF
jgi:Na+/H+-translocating membrane pyrophosphatase